MTWVTNARNELSEQPAPRRNGDMGRQDGTWAVGSRRAFCWCSRFTGKGGNKCWPSHQIEHGWIFCALQLFSIRGTRGIVLFSTRMRFWRNTAHVAVPLRVSGIPVVTATSMLQRDSQRFSATFSRSSRRAGTLVSANFWMAAKSSLVRMGLDT
jgi:hypothetical protein